MAFIPAFTSNITWVVQRTGDTDPYTTSLACSFGPGPFDTAAADALATSLAVATLPNLSTADTLVQIDFDYNDGLGTLSYSNVRNSIGTGATASATMVQNTAALFLKRTALPGRQGRGRMFWPYMQDTDVDAVGGLTGAAVTRYQTMITAWRTAITSSSHFNEPMLLHTTSTPDATPITSITVSPLAATQRRRLRR
jgi:hypothetical protein